VTNDKWTVVTGTVVQLETYVCFHKVFLTLCSLGLTRKL